jgi:hypothetical protein
VIDISSDTVTVTIKDKSNSFTGNADVAANSGKKELCILDGRKMFVEVTYNGTTKLSSNLSKVKISFFIEDQSNPVCTIKGDSKPKDRKDLVVLNKKGKYKFLKDNDDD